MKLNMEHPIIFNQIESFTATILDPLSLNLPFDVISYQSKIDKYFTDILLPTYHSIFMQEKSNDVVFDQHIEDLLVRHKKYLFVILHTNHKDSEKIVALAIRLWILSLIMDDILDGHESRLGLKSTWVSRGAELTKSKVLEELARVYSLADKYVYSEEAKPKFYVDLALDALQRHRTLSTSADLSDLIKIYIERQAFISIWPYVAQNKSSAIKEASSLLSVAGQIHNDIKDYVSDNIDGISGLNNFAIKFQYLGYDKRHSVVSSALLGILILRTAYLLAQTDKDSELLKEAILWRNAKLREWLAFPT